MLYEVITVSDYNYQAILERAAMVNSAAEVPAQSIASGPKVPWRMLVSDIAGVQWVDGPLFVQGTPEGTPLKATARRVHENFLIPKTTLASVPAENVPAWATLRRLLARITSYNVCYTKLLR